MRQVDSARELAQTTNQMQTDLGSKLALSNEHEGKHDTVTPVAEYRQRVSSTTRIFELPFKQLVSDQVQGSLQVVSRQLDSALVEQLKTFNPESLEALFIAVYHGLLAHYTNETDILISSLKEQQQDLLVASTVTKQCSGEEAVKNALQTLQDAKRLRAAISENKVQQLEDDFVLKAFLHCEPEKQYSDDQVVELVSSCGQRHPLAWCLSTCMLPGAELVRLIFDGDKYTAERMNVVVDHFCNILNNFLLSPQLNIGSLSYLSAEEEQQLLVDWNNTETDFPTLTLDQMISRQAEQTPDEIAVRVNDSAITYGELESSARKLAKYLNRCGAKREGFVAVYLHRSIDMVIALHAVMKTGAAYVPLDPLYPAERCGIMVEDSRAKLVVTTEDLADILAPYTPDHVRFICIHKEEDVINSESGDSDLVVSGRKEDDLAYAIFTSGSTGRPKGVQIKHYAIVNFLEAMRKSYGFVAADKMLAVSTVCFDVAGLELYMPLIAGGSVLVAKKDQAQDPSVLAQLIKDFDITFMQATASHWRMLVRNGWEGKQDLQALSCGEALPNDLATQLLPLVKKLWNEYGPTETTVYSTLKDVTEPNRITVGKPIDNNTVFVLDEDMKLLPVGIVGELYIGGIGVSPGYLHRENLTAERFFPNPFGRGRIYKTGDLARWTLDGEIEYLGRADFQVKIRGYRIELGEIEACLSTHPQIAQVVVDARRPEGSDANDNSDLRLVAYIVNKEEEEDVEEGQELVALEEPQASAQISKDLEEINQWGAIYDEAYASQNAANDDPSLNFSGYDNSYTPRVPHQIFVVKEWVETTCDRILELKPKRALEMGCGQGMILLRVAKHCEDYIGCDLSTQACQYVQDILDTHPNFQIPNTRVEPAGAHEALNYIHENLDTVICNGVSMYFPSADYLIEVIRNSLQSVTPTKGVFFLGDVRNNLLLKHFHSSVQLFQAANDGSVGNLRDQILHKIQYEKEFLVDPDFFFTLGALIPEIGEVRMDMKRGEFPSEFSMYRYDVYFWHANEELPGQKMYELESYSPEKHNVELLSATLSSGEAEYVAISGIPDGRLVQEGILVAKLLDNFSSIQEQNCRELRANVEAEAAQVAAINPEILYKLGISNGYHTEMMWNPNDPTALDVLFVKKDKMHEYATVALASRHNANTLEANMERSAESFTNKYAQSQNTAQQDSCDAGTAGKITVEEVRAFKTLLRARLPEYMVPAVYVKMECMPQTNNGKVDRKRLPEPTPEEVAACGNTQEGFVAPKGHIQEALAQMWAELLRVPEVSAEQDFFAAGGHSLLAMQLSSMVQNKWGMRLTMAQMVDNSQLDKMASCIEKLVDKMSGTNSDSEECTKQGSLALEPWTSSVEIIPNSKMQFKYKTIEQVWIPMSDNCNLAAKVWQPEVNVPVTAIIEINPYRRMDNTLEVDSITYPYLAGSGFTCVRVDVRGSGDSEGILDDEYSVQGIQDATEIVNWVSQQSWCNGNVVLMGVSWSGFTALQVASQEHPPEALKAIVVSVATDDRFNDDMHYMGGALLTENLSWGSWLLHTVSQAPITASPNHSSWVDHWKNRLQQLQPYHINWMQHPTRDAYWKHGSVCEDYSNLKVPVFASGGFNAGGYSNSLPRLAAALGSDQCRVLLGPWAHNFPHLSPLGPQYGFLQDVVQFVYGTVVGKPEKQMAAETAYSVFAVQPVEGKPMAHAATNLPGVWLSFNSYEESTKAVPEDTLYFTNQHSLSRAVASSLNGNTLQIDNKPVGIDGGRWYTFGNNDHLPTDQSEDDENCTIFETMNLDEDMLILGAPKIELVLQSPAEGIVAARLCAVSPEGVSHRITYGLKNLKYTDSNVVTIEMDYICYVVPVDYKLRIALSRDYWPVAWPESRSLLNISTESAFHFQWTQMTSDEIASAMEAGKKLPPATVHLPEPPSNTERIENGHAFKKTKKLSDGTVEVHDMDDRGCKVFTYGNNQKLQLSSQVQEKFTRSDNGVCHKVEWSTSQKFDNQVAEARLTTSMESMPDGKTNCVSFMSALHDGHVIYEKKWNHIV
eukprot:TRINITY_DN786_c0_g1_i7.p1 TRINITY_DN786_c0_g1~~TRINITY_DN786_c0_g1_i7.p1  ORF type:complete len:2036 (-),score=275.34 TRINITY_DN786_c0_g1_i7:531-6638(-)